MVIKLQLSGDIESNPGPVTRVTRSNLPGDDRLNEGKALIIQKAPAGVRLVLSLWEPGKSDIRQCMDKQFLVPALKESLGWLWKLPVTDKSIAKMNKQLVIENVILRFEALLPASCGTCKQEYCVKRDEPVPSLACHGCAQGFHQECLETLLGGLKEFPVLPGVTYWLCPLCSPTYSPPLTTVLGQERPMFRRKRLSPIEAAPEPEVPRQEEDPSAPPHPDVPGDAGNTAGPAEDAPDQPGLDPGVEGEDCPQYLLGTCQFGISGKNGDWWCLSLSPQKKMYKVHEVGIKTCQWVQRVSLPQSSSSYVY